MLSQDSLEEFLAERRPAALGLEEDPPLFEAAGLWDFLAYKEAVFQMAIVKGLRTMLQIGIQVPATLPPVVYRRELYTTFTACPGT